MIGGDANRPYSKKSGKSKFSHTNNSQYGMGDYYGTGVRAKIGRVRDDYWNQPMTSKNLKTPPKSLA